MRIDLPKEKWELLRDAVADVACWHMGFSAAKPDYDQPPQLQELKDIASHIKRQLNDSKE